MSANLLDMPGMTKYTSATGGPIPLASCHSNTLAQRNVILLATPAITEDNIFMNGLFQNIYVLYRMFESMGWLSMLIVNTKVESSKSPKYMRDLRIICVEDIVQSPIPIKIYVEIGMSIDPNIRKFFKMCGARICKLYLGNILNIDTETPIFYPSMNFAHHVIGELDDIWVSPHYAQHDQYARALNHVDLRCPRSTIVPYVWDSQMIFNNGERCLAWTKPEAGKEVFIIIEPNISFQKSSLIPLMILESWYRKNPEWKGQVILFNGDRLNQIPFFNESIMPSLELFKNGRVCVKGRMDILTIMATYPQGIPICHQWNNEYNYMVLEFFATGFPVLHNATDWKEYGYFYDGIENAASLVDYAVKNHSNNLYIYKAHAEALKWKHSPYNTSVQKAWNDIVSTCN